MNFPTNMTGYVVHLGVFRCACEICPRDYFLTPGMVAADSGICIFCENEIRELETLYAS